MCKSVTGLPTPQRHSRDREIRIRIRNQIRSACTTQSSRRHNDNSQQQKALRSTIYYVKDNIINARRRKRRRRMGNRSSSVAARAKSEKLVRDAVGQRKWHKTTNILKRQPQLAQELLHLEFDILWNEAPVEVVCAVLKAWPEAYKEKSVNGDNLLQSKMKMKQWDFVTTIFQKHPHVLKEAKLREAIEFEAPIEFLSHHWKETGKLFHSIYGRDWTNAAKILEQFFDLDRQQLTSQLSCHEIEILWKEAPVTFVRILLKLLPGAYDATGLGRMNLMHTKIISIQWDFVKEVIREFPHVVSVRIVGLACSFGPAPVNILGLMLDQQPDAPLQDTEIIFHLIRARTFDRFLCVLERCPVVAGVKEYGTGLTPILIFIQDKYRMNEDWIQPILALYPDAAKQKDCDGKTPLHLAYEHGASTQLINMIRQAYPAGENVRDSMGRTPRELENMEAKPTFTPFEKSLVLADAATDGTNDDKVYPNNAVALCRGEILMKDLSNTEQGYLKSIYSKQARTREEIFETLLDEFSGMVGIDDKDVIQKAAAVQALAAKHLSHQDESIIDFALYPHTGYWYQQEILKLVMRVYYEGQSQLSTNIPSIYFDSIECLKHLEMARTDGTTPEPGKEHVAGFQHLTSWLTKGIGRRACSFQGPVLKPLQSLFNKLFIRRGQTAVHVVGDMVRATLLVHGKEELRRMVEKVKTSFPKIIDNEFQHPDSFDRLVDFLNYVHDDLKAPVSSKYVLPYRFKKNSSQKDMKEPLWYNLNFFLQIPEYHRVGQSEMFVACELQIGLANEINKHRQTHVAYERDRILSNQPLLKNYEIATKRIERDDGDKRNTRPNFSNCTNGDVQLIEKILCGRIATEVLIPCNGNDDGMISFESGPFSLLEDQIKQGLYVKPTSLCINNRSLNWHAYGDPAGTPTSSYAAVVAGPYKLDETKQYYVESFALQGLGELATIGLYAHVGPYMIQIALGYGSQRNMVIVDSGRNYSYLERVCPVPVGTAALEVIGYSTFADETLKIEKINLSLKMFDGEKVDTTY